MRRPLGKITSFENLAFWPDGGMPKSSVGVPARWARHENRRAIRAASRHANGYQHHQHKKNRISGERKGDEFYRTVRFNAVELQEYDGSDDANYCPKIIAKKIFQHENIRREKSQYDCL